MEGNTQAAVRLELTKEDFLDLLAMLDYVAINDVAAPYIRRETARQLGRTLREKFMGGA
jgi:hypothetical protein